MTPKNKLKSHYEVIVIGAGPAGLAAARILKEAGKEVVILEKNKVIGKKVCAGGLTHKDLESGIPKDIISREFSSVLLHSHHKISRVRIEIPLAYTIDREVLGKWQYSIVKKLGVPLVTSTVIKVDQEKVYLNSGQEVSFDYLIGADGASSVVRRSLNLESKNLLVAFHYVVPKQMQDMELFVNVEKYGFTYLWIFPHQNFTSIGTGIDVTQRSKISDIKPKLEDFIKSKKIDLSKCQYESAPINYDYQGFEFGNMFLIGDAGGFTAPLTGEGIYNAIVTGEEVARKIIAPEYDTPKIQNILKYQNIQKRVLRLAQGMGNAADFFADAFMEVIHYRFVNKVAMDIL